MKCFSGGKTYCPPLQVGWNSLRACNQFTGFSSMTSVLCPLSATDPHTPFSTERERRRKKKGANVFSQIHIRMLHVRQTAVNKQRTHPLVLCIAFVSQIAWLLAPTSTGGPTEQRLQRHLQSIDDLHGCRWLMTPRHTSP